jgi:hypothetical protein
MVITFGCCANATIRATAQRNELSASHPLPHSLMMRKRKQDTNSHRSQHHEMLASEYPMISHKALWQCCAAIRREIYDRVTSCHTTILDETAALLPLVPSAAVLLRRVRPTHS